VSKHAIMIGAAFLCVAAWTYGQQPATSSAQPTNLGSDPNGNPLRLALKSGHISNYDESKVRPYVLPDPLVTPANVRVRDARAWRTRRTEILRLYETEIYGRVPANAPIVTWRVAETDQAGLAGAAVSQHVVGTVGSKPDGPRINLDVYTPAHARRPVPVVLMVNFGGGDTARGRGIGATTPTAGADILAKGWGYATVGYQDIQPDRANSWTQGVIGMTLAAGASQPAPDEWGTISAWAWGISRIVDYLETDKLIDGRQIAIQGHSRLGKTVLWAGARDERIAAVFSSCGGEMGSALARRDWGETVDDMAQNFAWQFAGNFQKWVGRWNDMPVDAHMLIALNAPRPVFISGGTTDQWSDPVGEFLAEVAAGPVYELLGRKGLGVAALPPLDTPVVGGDLGWHYHTGGHAATPGDWNAFLQFLTKYFRT
jgi:(4-O-methyl)-D-glucuronate---lignin esterase